MKQQKGISTILSILLVVLLVIAIGGAVAYKYYLAPGEEPSTGETPGEVQDETADWKTYQSQGMGFSIKCPSDFKIHLDIQPLDVPSRDLLVSTFFVKDEITDEGLIMIEIELWTKLPEEIWGEGFTFQDFVNDEIEFFKSRFDPQLKQEDFVLNDNLATKVSYIEPYQNQIVRIVYSQKGERMFKIAAWIASESQNIYLPTFNQILSTFRFLE